MSLPLPDASLPEASPQVDFSMVEPKRGVWIRNEVPPRRKRPSKLPILFWLPLVSLLVMLGVIQGAAEATAIFAFLVPLVAWVFAWVVEGDSSDPEEEKLRLENPSDPNVGLVEVQVFQDGLLTARSIGMAFWEDEALIFVGDDFSFSVGGQDLDPARRAKPGGEEANDDGSVSVPLWHPVRKVEVRIKMRPTPDWHRANRHAAWLKRLVRWVHARPVATSLRQYPPLSPSVKILDRVRRRRQKCERWGLSVSLVFLPLVFFSPFSPGFFLFVVIPPLVGFLAWASCMNGVEPKLKNIDFVEENDLSPYISVSQVPNAARAASSFR